MNYLQLCQRVHDIAGFQGQFNSVSATGYQAVIVRAVQDAYEDIQRYRDDWDFLQKRKVVGVGPSQSVYTLADLGLENLQQYKYVNFNSRRMMEMEFETYQLYDFSNWSTHQPHYWSWEYATMDFYISPVGENYDIEINYIDELDTLSINTDTPRILSRHHQCIVYGALMKVGTYLGKMTLYDMYAIKYAEALGQLMRESNPPKRITKRPIA